MSTLHKSPFKRLTENALFVRRNFLGLSLPAKKLRVMLEIILTKWVKKREPRLTKAAVFAVVSFKAKLSPPLFQLIRDGLDWLIFSPVTHTWNRHLTCSCRQNSRQGDPALKCSVQKKPETTNLSKNNSVTWTANRMWQAALPEESLLV